MNNPTNTILTKVINFAQTSSVFTKVADKLLNSIVLHEDASAGCVTLECTACFGGGTTRVRYCTLFCCIQGIGAPVCYTQRKRYLC